MLPITGPITTSSGTSSVRGLGSYRKHTIKYKQKKPVDRPLAYLNTFRRCTAAGSYGVGGYTDPGIAAWTDMNAATSPGGYVPYTLGFQGGYAPIDTLLNDTMLKCRDRYVGAMKNATAALAVSLAERRQAMDMMTARLSQIYRFTRAVARFQWTAAATELGLSRQQRTKFLKLKGEGRFKNSAKHFGNNWLEFHFGWAPLIGDIHDAMEVLVDPVPPRAVVRWTKKIARTSVFTTSFYGGYSSTTHKSLCRVTMGSTVEVSNPNLLLLNRLGVLNPAIVAWEIVPFSFVVDWFVNVSDFLEQFTEFAGVTRTNGYYSYKLEDQVTGLASYVYGKQIQTWSCESRSFQRFLGDPPSITLKVKAPWSLSPSRGLTAASLLVQQGFGVTKPRYAESRVRTTKWPLYTDYFHK